MSTLAQVASGIATTIGTATSLRVLDHVGEDLNPPALFVALGENERGAMARGQQDVMFEAVVFVSRGVTRVGQAALYEYASFTGTKSVWKAIDDTPGLGLADTNAAVIRYRPFGIDDVAAYGYLGGVFEILVVTKGA